MQRSLIEMQGVYCGSRAKEIHAAVPMNPVSVLILSNPLILGTNYYQWVVKEGVFGKQPQGLLNPRGGEGLVVTCQILASSWTFSQCFFNKGPCQAKSTSQALEAIPKDHSPLDGPITQRRLPRAHLKPQTRKVRNQGIARRHIAHKFDTRRSILLPT